jgi:hypothetical protein
MRWKLLGAAQALGALASLVLWIAVRAMRGNFGEEVSFDIFAGGLGVLVIGLVLLALGAAATLLRGQRPRWVGWVELLLIPALLYVSVWAVQDMTADNGAPAFYLSIASLALLGAVIVAVASIRILSETRTR